MLVYMTVVVVAVAAVVVVRSKESKGLVTWHTTQQVFVCFCFWIFSLKKEALFI